MSRVVAIVGALAVFVMTLSPASAIRPDEILPDPSLEARARALSKELRCLVCQNQSIDDSEADLAGDLRRVVRERLLAGDSDPQVIRFVTDRYGDFVLLRPPFKATTYILWLGPAAVLLVGVGTVWLYLRRRRAAPAATPPLTDAERRRLDSLVGGER
jgi:cytochrome c-type biogenesis protein CcmH